jgi:hypothetical protein
MRKKILFLAIYLIGWTAPSFAETWTCTGSKKGSDYSSSYTFTRWDNFFSEPYTLLGGGKMSNLYRIIEENKDRVIAVSIMSFEVKVLQLEKVENEFYRSVTGPFGPNQWQGSCTIRID